ncbi:acyltransferase [Photobacterium phosphoreum]|uniref:acyltransferase n=1 Tax=Photobacterium phosphoreum TaxID=659 RepID=UPI000D151DCB|nr:acyltransferase [Photobacterium phosphoreum]PTB31260.1 acyltransferase [Photobacterium phosphoreum]
MIRNLLDKYKFDIHGDRLGPDLPFTHWRLYFNKLSDKLCKKKFKRFGLNASFRPGAYAITCSQISLGNNVVIRPLTMLFASSIDPNGTITIEDNVLIGSGVHIYVSNHEFKNNNKDIFSQGHQSALPVFIKKGAWIGANSIILPGVTIGTNAVVGAGSVVTKDIPARTVFVGNPAMKIR